MTDNQIMFIRENRTVPIYKGAWSKDNKRLSVWLTNGKKYVLSSKFVDDNNEVFKWGMK